MKASKFEVAAAIHAEAERTMNETARVFAAVPVVGSRPEDFKAHRANLDKIHAAALEIQRKRRGF